MGLGAVVPRVSIVATDFAREVQTHGLGIVFSMFLEFGPFAEVLRKEVQLGNDHIRFLNGMHALRPGLESFFAPPLIGDHFLDQSFGFRDGHVEKSSSSSSVDMGS